MRKNFILDTNVLLHDPRSIFSFDDNNVVIPIYVIEEIDQFKRDLSELGRNARQVSRYLDAFRAEGSLAEGVPLPGRRDARASASPTASCPVHWRDGSSMDNRILAVAIDLKEREPDCQAIFVTKDTNLRIRADALGLTAEDYDVERVEISELYTGLRGAAGASRAWWTRCTRQGAEVESAGQDRALPQPVRAASRTRPTPRTPPWAG